MSTQPPSIARYVFLFVVANTVLSVPLMVVSYLLRVGSNAALSIAIAVLSALFAKRRFVTEQGRSPASQERLLLTVASFLAAIALSLALPVAVVFGVAGSQGVAQLVTEAQSTMSNLDLPIFLAITIPSLLACFLLLYFAYGPRRSRPESQR